MFKKMMKKNRVSFGCILIFREFFFWVYPYSLFLLCCRKSDVLSNRSDGESNLGYSADSVHTSSSELNIGRFVYFLKLHLIMWIRCLLKHIAEFDGPSRKELCRSFSIFPFAMSTVVTGWSVPDLFVLITARILLYLWCKVAFLP